MTAIAIDPNRLTHMPFLFRYQNQLMLAYCASDETPRRVPQYGRTGTTRVWKLYWMPFRDGVGVLAEAKRIRTGLPENEVECSPCLSRDGGNICLSFIGTARHGTGPLAHFLYRTSGPDLDRLEPAQRVGDSPCYAGFSRPDLTVTAGGDDGHIRLDGKTRASVETDFHTISRISFCFDHPSRLLITGVSQSDRARSGPAALHCTIVYDVDQRQVIGQLQVDGRPLYKPTICSGMMSNNTSAKDGSYTPLTASTCRPPTYKPASKHATNDADCFDHSIANRKSKIANPRSFPCQRHFPFTIRFILGFRRHLVATTITTAICFLAVLPMWLWGPPAASWSWLAATSLAVADVQRALAHLHVAPLPLNVVVIQARHLGAAAAELLKR